ncbi:MAG: hypothetical protein AB7E85_06765 [Pseudobdellovibrionaceae bacterium]
MLEENHKKELQILCKKMAIIACIVFGTIGGIAGCAYVIYKLSYPSTTFNYKVTINVETSKGLKSGFAVRQIHMYRKPMVLTSRRGYAKVRGEAVVIDMGECGLIYNILQVDPYREVLNSFNPSGGLTSEAIKEYAKKPIGTKVSLAKDQMFLVYFDSIDDFRTVHVLRDKEDYIKCDIGNIEGSLEITDLPISENPPQMLPVFGNSEEYVDWIADIPMSDPRHSISPMSFRRIITAPSRE